MNDKYIVTKEAIRSSLESLDIAANVLSKLDANALGRTNRTTVLIEKTIGDLVRLLRDNDGLANAPV